jgi:hypothetical protein
VAWGNDADGQFQGLTASKLLPQLTQDAFLLGGWYDETLRKLMLERGLNGASRPAFSVSAPAFACGKSDTAI